MFVCRLQCYHLHRVLRSRVPPFPLLEEECATRPTIAAKNIPSHCGSPNRDAAGSSLCQNVRYRFISNHQISLGNTPGLGRREPAGGAATPKLGRLEAALQMASSRGWHLSWPTDVSHCGLNWPSLDVMWISCHGWQIWGQEMNSRGFLLLFFQRHNRTVGKAKLSILGVPGPNDISPRSNFWGRGTL